MATRIKLDTKVLDLLRKDPEILLGDLGPICAETASEILSASKPLVPVAKEHEGSDPRLVDTGFVDGPEVNHQRETVTATAGYAHPNAGAISEGFHYGFQTVNPPPHFLKKVVKPFRTPFKKKVAAQIKATLAKLAPKT